MSSQDWSRPSVRLSIRKQKSVDRNLPLVRPEKARDPPITSSSHHVTHYLFDLPTSFHHHQAAKHPQRSDLLLQLAHTVPPSIILIDPFPLPRTYRHSRRAGVARLHQVRQRRIPDHLWGTAMLELDPYRIRNNRARPGEFRLMCKDKHREGCHP